MSEQNLWSTMVQVLRREGAIRLWIIYLLHDVHQRPWQDVVRLLPQPNCGILADADLPPGVTWAEVEQAFQRIRLTPQALRQFYSRAQQVLQRYTSRP